MGFPMKMLWKRFYNAHLLLFLQGKNSANSFYYEKYLATYIYYENAMDPFLLNESSTSSKIDVHRYGENSSVSLF